MLDTIGKWLRGGVVSLALGLSLLAGPALAQVDEDFQFVGPDGAIETWIPTVTGSYRVTATGARGGGTAIAMNGGHGATVSAIFTLTAGTEYSIAVGQVGDQSSPIGGGGGGTFFVQKGTSGDPDQPLLVAGGGGGSGGAQYTGSGADAAANVVHGTGLGGQGINGGGGGGFASDGGNIANYSNPGNFTGAGGKSWANGLAGGNAGSGSGTVMGGFGGGGSGQWPGGSGGGGGGYSGGDGGEYTLGGGAGTSFSAGDDTTAVVATSGLGSLTITFIPVPSDDTSDAAEAAIANFLTTRNQLLMSNTPDINQFIDRFYGGGDAPGAVSIFGYSASTDLPLDLQLGTNAMSFSYSSARQAADAAAGVADDSTLLAYSPVLGTDAVAPSDAVNDLAFWAQGSFAKASDNTLFGVVHVGGDYLVTDQLLIGIAGEIDSMQQDVSTASLSGVGYSVGPYVTVKLSENLFLDARVAGGQSFNEITPSGQGTDAFTGTRWLGSTALVGRFDAGVVRIQPSAKLSAMTETTGAYTDSNNNAVSSVTATTATAEIGPKLSLIPEQPGDFTPYLGLTGTWTFHNSSTAGTAPDIAALRGRVEAGATVGSANGLSAKASTYYDGIGSNWNAWGASLGVSAALD